MRLEKHDQTCADLIERLRDVAHGYTIKCPNCGGFVSVECIDDETGQIATCPECGHVDDAHTFETLDFFEFFEGGIYDIKYVVDDQLDYVGARVCVAWGGPSIYIDTFTATVELFNWNETGQAHGFDAHTLEELNGCFRSLFNEAHVGHRPY